MKTSKSFAVIPAAGRSRRMGPTHKLLLQWNGSNVIRSVLGAWSRSRVDRIVIVTRHDDEILHRHCRSIPRVELVVADEDPEDMKRSVLLAIGHLSHDSPKPEDRWMLAPADLPTLTTSLIYVVIESSRDSSKITVPHFDRRPGHPISVPWRLADHVEQLGPDEGINRLLEHHATESINLPMDQYPQDIDTEEEYQRLLREHGMGRPE